MEITENGIETLKGFTQETDCDLVLKVSKVERLPHLPLIKRKLNVFLTDNENTLDVKMNQNPVGKIIHSENLKNNDII